MDRQHNISDPQGWGKAMELARLVGKVKGPDKKVAALLTLREIKKRLGVRSDRLPNVRQTPTG